MYQTHSFAVAHRTVVASVLAVTGPVQQITFDLMLGANDTPRQQKLDARRILRQFGYLVQAVESIVVPS